MHHQTLEHTKTECDQATTTRLTIYDDGHTCVTYHHGYSHATHLRWQLAKKGLPKSHRRNLRRQLNMAVKYGW